LKRLERDKIFSKKDHLRYCLVFTLATTGLRISECLQITKDMLDSGILKIVQKQGRLRSLLLPEKTKEILMDFIELYPSNSSFVFTTESNHVLRRQNAYKYIHELTKKKYGCHSFRKSVIEILLSQNYHSHEVAKVSGHNSINMVFYYDTRDEETSIHAILSDIYDHKQQRKKQKNS
jgi:integrase